MFKDLGLSVVAGLASALVFLSVLTGGGWGAVLAYVMPLPLVMIGFSWGFGRALLGCGLALAVVLVAAPSAIPVFATVTLLPTLILVHLARQYRLTPGGDIDWYPPGSLLAWLAAAAVGLMILGTSLSSGQGVSFEDETRHYITELVDQFAPLTPTEVRDAAIALWSAMFPAMLGNAWLIMAVANGVLAQWTVAKAGHSLRPTPAYVTAELPLWALAALVSAAVLGLTAGGNIGYLGRNAAVILMVPQVFVGLTVVHQALRRRPNTGMMLVIFYVAFFVMFSWALVAVAGLGLVRHWTRLRRRDVEGSQEEK
jgi:hypothetical protein